MTDWIADGESGASVRAKLNSSIGVVAPVSVSNADLKALNSSPKQIVAAPGAGKYINLLTWRLIVPACTVAFTGVDGPSLVYAGTSPITDNLADSFDFIFQGNIDGYVSFGYAATREHGGYSSRLFEWSKVENKAIVLTDTSDWTLGDATATVAVTYQIVDLV